MNNKIFTTLFFCVFASVTGVGLVVPLLPVYARDLGASGFMVGMIFGSFSISRTFLLPYFGKLSDIRGRKPFIASGLFLYALVSVAFMASEGVYELVFIRFLQGIASAMILPVVQAYVGEMAPKGREGYVMGMFNISMYASLSLGPLLGGVVEDRLGLNTAFAAMGVLSLVAFAMSVLFLPPAAQEPRPDKGTQPLGFRILLRNGIILGAAVLRMAYTFCIGAIWGFLPVFADNEFGLSSSSIGFLIMLGVLTSGFLQPPVGKLSDRWDKRAMIFAGGLILAASVFSFQYAQGFWWFFWSNIAVGIGGGILVPPLTALCVIEGAREKSMGSVMAILTVGHSLGMMVGALVSGILMDLFSLRAAFVAGAVVVLAGTLFFMFVSGRKVEASPVT